MSFQKLVLQAPVPSSRSQAKSMPRVPTLPRGWGAFWWAALRLPAPVPSQDQLRFPRMLMKLVSLRTLSSVHSEQVFALRLQDKKLPPLLSEIWDVHE